MHAHRAGVRRQKQGGAVLITSLVLLVVMTLLAVTSMRTAVMGERMVTNAAFTNRAFQVAESAIVASMYSTDDAVLATALIDGAADVDLTGMDANTSSSAQVTSQDMNSPPCPGGSIGLARGNTFKNEYFRIVAQGALVSGGDTLASQSIEAGVSYCVPAS